jgi:hypothetical protein
MNTSVHQILASVGASAAIRLASSLWAGPVHSKLASGKFGFAAREHRRV